MKLIVTKITDRNDVELSKLIDQFYCKIDIANTKEAKITINKHPDISRGEFGLLAGKLVMIGCLVELHEEA